MKLTKEQLEAINEIEHNLQIIACAGSGKTEVIVRRIAHILKIKEEIKPDNIVAFTFTNKAAESMKDRIYQFLSNDDYSKTNDLKNMYIGTIHSYCFNLLHQYCEDFNNFKILDTVKTYHFIYRYYAKCGMRDLGLERNPNKIKLFSECIEKLIDDYDNREHWEQNHRDSFEKYKSCLYEHGYFDFSLLLFETIQQTRNNPMLEKYLSNVKYLVVDEYQDVNDLQEMLINYLSRLGTNICVVGDDDQTIYQFRGSNANNMINFGKNYQDVVQIQLDKNFRCGKGIVDIADTVIMNNKERLPKDMISQVEINNECETIANRFNSSEEQYEAIADKITHIHQLGVNYFDIAILVRKGKYINPIIKELESKKIPYATDSADYFFNGFYFGRFVETLRILMNVDKAKLYKCWQGYMIESHFDIGYKYLRQAAQLGGNGKVLPISRILEEFVTRIGFLVQVENDDELNVRRDDLSGFKLILEDYDEIFGDQQFSARITGLLKFLDTKAEEKYEYHSFKTKGIDEDTVNIMTIHKSKGLEFNTVFIVELEEKEFPMSNFGGDKYWSILGGTFQENKEKYRINIEDERKLFYVAVTRAKQRLYLYYELSKKNLSTFAREAADSAYLEIDKNDLIYKNFKNGNVNFENEENNVEDGDFEQQRQFSEQVKRARNELIRFYSTGMLGGNKLAGGMILSIDRMSDEEILVKARKIGFRMQDRDDY